jgi:putative hydrolase of the HAD superfamily
MGLIAPVKRAKAAISALPRGLMFGACSERFPAIGLEQTSIARLFAGQGLTASTNVTLAECRPGRRLMRAKTIFFDVGGTLIDSPQSPIPVWLKLLDNLGLHADSRLLNEALREADTVLLPQIYNYKGLMEEFWLRYDRLVLEKLHIRDPDGKYSKIIERGFDNPELFRLFPESVETLQNLQKAGFRLAVISNNTDDVYKHLEWFDLRKYFDSITYSQEAKAEKPDPAIFLLALKRAQCRPEEAVHVGDSYKKDVVGARRAGILPILVDRANQHPEADCRRTMDLSEVPRMIEEAPSSNSPHAPDNIVY